MTGSGGTDVIVHTRDAGGGKVAFCASAVDAVVETAAAAHVHLRSGHVIAVPDYASIVSAIWGERS